MDKVKKFLKDLLTEADNHTFDLAKILALIAIVDGNKAEDVDFSNES